MYRRLFFAALAFGVALGITIVASGGTAGSEHSTTTTTGRFNCLALGCPGSPPALPGDGQIGQPSVPEPAAPTSPPAASPSPPAPAAPDVWPPDEWFYAIGRCEQPGPGGFQGVEWDIHGPTYQGGLGILDAAWWQYGPAVDPTLPRNGGDATPAQQIVVARRIYAAAGPGAWGCTHTVGPP